MRSSVDHSLIVLAGLGSCPFETVISLSSTATASVATTSFSAIQIAFLSLSFKEILFVCLYSFLIDRLLAVLDHVATSIWDLHHFLVGVP
jgi:hypothetical protein